MLKTYAVNEAVKFWAIIQISFQFRNWNINRSASKRKYSQLWQHLIMQIVSVSPFYGANKMNWIGKWVWQMHVNECQLKSVCRFDWNNKLLLFCLSHYNASSTQHTTHAAGKIPCLHFAFRNFSFILCTVRFIISLIQMFSFRTALLWRTQRPKTNKIKINKSFDGQQLFWKRH